MSRFPGELSGAAARVRLRLPALLEEHDMSAYRLSKASEGRISLAAVYRLVKAKGPARYLDANLPEAVCRVLSVGPGDLFELDGFQTQKPSQRRKSAGKAAPARAKKRER